MRRILLLATCFLITALSLSAQKALKEVRSSLKSNNYKEALTKIEKLRADSSLRDDPRLCLYSIEANRGLNDAENTKLYLKKAYDTVAFFSTTRQIVEQAVRLDSMEAAALEDAQRRFKYKNYKTVSESVLQYYANLGAGASYFYRKGKYAEAMPYMCLSLDLLASPLGVHLALPDKHRTAGAALYLTAAYYAKQYGEVNRYDTLALQEQRMHALCLECLAFTAREQKDNAAYRGYLETGWKAYPEMPVFFSNLADYHSARKEYVELLQIAQVQRAAGHTPNAALLAETIARFNLGQYDSCVAVAAQLIALDSLNAEAYYYKGASYIAQADAVDLPENVTAGPLYRKVMKQRRALLAQAEPEIEAYRTLSPKEQSVWAPILYRIYYALNRGKKFAEIEKVMAGGK